MRLIDGDALLRNIRRAVYPSDLNTTIAVGICESHVKDMPTIDAVPVVQCKDCKWWNEEWKHEDGECYCYKIDQWTAPQFFCASGERRDVNATG